MRESALAARGKETRTLRSNCEIAIDTTIEVTA
jgi:hypothetical protein